MPSPTPLPNTTPDETLQSKVHELELASKERETQMRGAALGVPYINLKGFPVNQEALALLPENRARELEAIAFLYTGEETRIGAVDPTRKEIQELRYQIEERTHTRGGLYIISKESLALALKLYAALPKIKKIIRGVEIPSDELEKYQKEIENFKDLQGKITSVPITDVLVLMIAASIQARSSDVHIEAEENDVKIRFRVDGALVDAAKLDRDAWPRIISRIKLISGLKINVTNRPQDGRFTIFLKQEKIDVRVSTIPTAYGESVVMRLLRQAAVALDFDALGVRGLASERLKRAIEKPNGMIITTGPTGSGKTTTLYAVLKKLNSPDTKIITLEDPIEYRVEGLNQSQIDPSKEYTFAQGLRSILRQDPDIVMVGEIRDLETADISVQAALTGHLVLSTIHTNDAAGAIPRFLSMGVKPFLLAPALNAVVGQRLVRRIHEDCKVDDELDAATLERVKKTLADMPEKSGQKVDLNALKFWKGKGCSACGDIGYKGRVGVYEVFTLNAEIEKLTLAGNLSQYEMAAAAKRDGMITMAQDGLLKALDGITSVEEVFSVAE